MNAEEQLRKEKINYWCREYSWLLHAALACIAYFVGDMQYGAIAWLSSSILQILLGNKSEIASILAFSGLILTACGL